MAKFLLTYDLRKKRDYETLYAKLRTYDGKRLLESVWIITSDKTPSEIRDDFERVVDNDDGVAVLKLARGWGTLRCKADGIRALRA